MDNVHKRTKVRKDEKVICGQKSSSILFYFCNYLFLEITSVIKDKIRKVEGQDPWKILRSLPPIYTTSLIVIRAFGFSEEGNLRDKSTCFGLNLWCERLMNIHFEGGTILPFSL